MGKQLTRLVGVPVNLGIANAAGVDLDFVRRDHVHNHPALAWNLHHGLYARYLWDVFDNGSIPQPVGAAATVGLVPIQVPFTVTVDRLVEIVTVAAGNTWTGIYADNGDTPVGGALLVESGSFPVGAVGKLEIPIATTQLQERLYWIAQMVDAAAVAGGFTALRNDVEWVRAGTLTGYFFVHPVGFTNLPNPCPAAAPITLLLNVGVRVASVP